jgi:hypothetical protein
MMFAMKPQIINKTSDPGFDMMKHINDMKRLEIFKRLEDIKDEHERVHFIRQLFIEDYNYDYGRLDGADYKEFGEFQIGSASYSAHAFNPAESGRRGHLGLRHMCTM